MRFFTSIKKLGTIHADTNCVAGISYKPSPRWLEGLFQDKKLKPEQYLQLSAELSPVGHATRKRDVEEVLREHQQSAVAAIVAAEQEALARDAPLDDVPLEGFPAAQAFVESFRTNFAVAAADLSHCRGDPFGEELVGA